MYTFKREQAQLDADKNQQLVGACLVGDFACNRSPIWSTHEIKSGMKVCEARDATACLLVYEKCANALWDQSVGAALEMHKFLK